MPGDLREDIQASINRELAGPRPPIPCLSELVASLEKSGPERAALFLALPSKQKDTATALTRRTLVDNQYRLLQQMMNPSDLYRRPGRFIPVNGPPTR